MARIWMCLFVAAASVVALSNGQVKNVPQMVNPPLLNWGLDRAGDDQIKNFDTSKEIKLDFNISYFGSSYNAIYISSDGLISFVPNVRFLEGVTWSEGIRNADADRPFLAPFYHDGYNPIREGHENFQGKLFYRVIYQSKLDQPEAVDDTHYSEEKLLMTYFSEYVNEAVINPPKDFKAELLVVVTWVDVTDKISARNKEQCDLTPNKPCKAATFQAVIVADKEGNTFAVFNYLKMNVPYQGSYQSGFNGGYERGWFNVIPCHGSCALALNKSRVNDLANLKGSNYKGRYFLNVGEEMIVRGGCLPTSLRAGMLEVYPREVGMFGGEKLQISGKCLSATSKIYCKFGEASDSPVTTGVMTNEMKGYCHVPLLTTRGQTKVSWSSDGQDWSAEKYITVVLPNHVNEPVQTSAQDKSDWYKRDSSSITVKWSPERMSTKSSAKVEVKLIGYRETESKVEFKELENFGEAPNSAGRYTFDTAAYPCTSNCKEFEMGLLEVALNEFYYGDASDRVALRFGPIPLGWYVNKELTEKDGSDWSDDMCRRWRDEDKKSTAWLSKLPKCPCSLAQVLADFGRWQPGDTCNMFKNTGCEFHKKAKHCVRSFTHTDDAAGNQCCYDESGALIYSQLSHQGSTPDRAHDWGMRPYNIPGRVPSMSHWKHDVIPFFHCCLWNDFELCDLYTRLRPTTDCDAYEVPGLAFVRGDPHISTFDGQTYHFGGRGDFWLLDHQDVSIQGLFQPRLGSWDLGKMRRTDKTSWFPTALTSVVIQGGGQIVEIHPAPENANPKRGLDIRVGKDRYMFLTETTKWQDFTGQSIINNALKMQKNPHNNFTIITRNVGIQVVAMNNLLQVTVVIPPSMKLQENANLMGMGLMGMFDGNTANDYVSKSNTQSSPEEEPEKLYKNFALSWAVSERDSLFPFPTDPSKYTNHIPYYKYNEIPHDFPQAPTASQISSTCGDDDNCKWDYRISGSRLVAQATKEADIAFTFSQGSAYKVENCGLPDIGEMAILSSYNFSVGKEITVTGCDHDHSFDGTAKFSCIMERLDIAEKEDRDHYGRDKKEKNVDYKIHWVPRPSAVCHPESTSGVNIGMIAGIIVGVIVVIVLIVVIVIFVRRKRNGASKNIQREKPKPADRVRRDRQIEEGTHEPMISNDRNPVYKPSKNAPASSAV